MRLAGCSNLPLPDALGETYFAQDPTVVVQLVNGAGSCWTSEFAVGDTQINEVDSIKAQSR